MNFTTKLSGNNATAFNTNKENHDSYAELTVEWEFVTEMREWGVKGIYVYITKVIGTVALDFWDHDKKDEVINIHTDDVVYNSEQDVKWAIEQEFASNYELGDCIQPQSICVDIESSIITVYFY